MARFVVIVLAILVWLVPNFANSAVIVNNGKFQFSWTIADQLITFTVAAETSGYWALGFSPTTGTMTGADMAVGFMNSGVGVLQHRRSTGHTTPVLVPNSSVYTLISASAASNGTLTFVFSRLLDPNNAQDATLAKTGLNKLIWSVGPISGSNPLTHIARGQIDVDFSSTEEPPAQKVNYKDILLVLHGISMTFAWVFCASLGIFVARFLKNKLGVWWFRLHIITLILAVLLTLIGIIFAVFGMASGTHFTHPHHLIGVVVMMGAFVQPLLGVAADRLFNPSRSGVPFFPDQLHWWIGRLTHLLGVVNVLFGVWLLQQRGGAPLIVFYLNYVFIGIIVVLSIGVSLAFEASGGAAHHVQAQETPIPPIAKVHTRDVTTSPLLQAESEADSKKSE